jgi:hypothetical protein
VPHDPLRQVELKQSASLAHLELHEPVAALQANGAHKNWPITTQAPRPSHEGFRRAFPSHLSGAQLVPSGTRAQVPTRLGSTQLSQAPSQGEVQQTPCAQN